MSTETIVACNPSDVHQYRLRVWHYTPRRRNYQDNKNLADFLDGKDLKGWVIQPVVPADSEKATQGIFVPLEVDLRYLAPHPIIRFLQSRTVPDDAVSNLTEIFSKTLESWVVEFYQTHQNGGGGEPQQMVLFPVTDGLAKTTRSAHTHVKSLAPWARKSYTAINHSSIPNTSMVEEAAGVSERTIRAVRKGQEMARVASKEGEFTTEIADQIQKVKPENDKGKKSGKTQDTKLVLGSEIMKKWKEAEQLMDSQATVLKEMEDASRMVSNRQVNPQQLHETIINAYNASARLSKYEEYMGVVTNDIARMRKGNDQKDHASLAAIAVMIVTLACVTGGASIIVTGATAGATAAGIFFHEVYERILKDKPLLLNFSSSIKSLRNALDDARAAFTIVFCSEVLGISFKPEDRFDETQRNHMLRSLGIDVAELKDEHYNQVLIPNKVKRLRQAYQQWQEQVEKVQAIANVTSQDKYEDDR